MTSRGIVCFLALLVATNAAWAAPLSCGPSSDLDKANRLRVSEHRPDLARDIARAVLAKDRSNLRAQYTLGLSLVDLSGKKPNPKSASYIDGMNALNAVSNALAAGLNGASSAVRACLQQQGVLAVNNSLGSYYLAAGDLGQAEFYLRRGESIDKQGLLTGDSHAKQNANLGHLYYAYGDNARAKTYLSEAQKSGDKSTLVGAQLRALAPIGRPLK